MSYLCWRDVQFETTNIPNEFRTLQDFYYPLNDGSGKAVLIKAGFKTDGASIPKLFWNIYDPIDPEYRNAALLHDGLYAAELFPRDICDDWLKTAMRQLGNGWFAVHVFQLAVGIGGGGVWSRHTDASRAEAREYVSLIDAVEEAPAKEAA